MARGLLIVAALAAGCGGGSPSSPDARTNPPTADAAVPDAAAPDAAPPRAPSAPSGVQAAPGAGGATVSWTAPGDGGSAITAYRVTAAPGGMQVTVDRPFAMIGGLVNGTAYTFTVVARNAVGESPMSAASAPVSPDASLEAKVDGQTAVGTVKKQQFGLNLLGYTGNSGPEPSLTTPLALNALATIKPRLLRWPGGVAAETYHWQTNTYSDCTQLGNPIHGPAAVSFDDFMQKIAGPLGADVAITVNISSNAACTGPPDVAEAVEWVRYANVVKGYGIKLWSLGNEYNGAPNPDFRDPPHDPTVYAGLLATYSKAMKAVDPTISIGADIGAGALFSDSTVWDTTVLEKGTYDFVEYHTYGDSRTFPFPPSDDDRLLGLAVGEVDEVVGLARARLAAAGRAGTPLYFGEFNAPGLPGKQTASIVGALYLGMTFAEAIQLGVDAATMWNGWDNGCGTLSAADPAVYGWQDFGTYSLFQVNDPGHPEYYGCAGAHEPPQGTPFAQARAMQILARYAVTGATVLPATTDASALRAWSLKTPSGYALLLFNLDRSRTVSPAVSIAGEARASFSATTSTYGKAEYDGTRDRQWLGPTEVALGTVGNPFWVPLPPWSMTLVLLE